MIKKKKKRQVVQPSRWLPSGVSGKDTRSRSASRPGMRGKPGRPRQLPLVLFTPGCSGTEIWEPSSILG